MAMTRRTFMVSGAEVVPGVRSLPAFGHTPGHTVFTVEGGRRRLMFWADTTNVAARQRLRFHSPDPMTPCP